MEYTQIPINPLLAKRKSPRAFSSEPVSKEALTKLFKAASWAASSFNEQPWRFVYATKENSKDFNKLTSCLVEGNNWAKEAPVIILTIAKTSFTYNGNTNRHAWHDIGQAVANMAIQAIEDDLYIHQMAGFIPEKATDALNIPKGFEPVSMIALGYLGNPEDLPEALKVSEKAERTRKDISEFVFEGSLPENSEL